MENATKALLIAASVLIVIVIIALGVRLLNSSSTTANQADEVSKEISETTNSIVDEMGEDFQDIGLNKKERFNRKFEKYFDSDASPEKARQLLQTVIKNLDESDRVIFLSFQRKQADGRYKQVLGQHSKGKVSARNNCNRILEAIRDDKTYKIVINTSCSDYKKNNGYTSDGYIGCIAIREK